MAKKNKKNTKASNKVLRDKISHYLIFLRKRGLTVEEFEFYCDELDFYLLKYSGKDKEHLGKLYKAWVRVALLRAAF